MLSAAAQRVEWFLISCCSAGSCHGKLFVPAQKERGTSWALPARWRQWREQVVLREGYFQV